MYLIGAPHRHKADAQRLLEKLLSERMRLVTDAEVLQEIMRRYAAIDRLDAVQPAFEALLGLIDEVLPVDLATVERAKEILLGTRRLSARDCLHQAPGVMSGSRWAARPNPARPARDRWRNR